MSNRKTLGLFTLAFFSLASVCAAQAKTDSVIINVGEKSKVIFAIGDKADLETLKQYDFQAVVNDLVSKLENKDTISAAKPAEEYRVERTEPTVVDQAPVVERSRDDWDESWENRERSSRKENRRYYGRRTHHSFNLDFGTNNFLTPDYAFPNQNNESYSVRPWGSWYVGINSVERTRIARKFFVEWGLGVSWYNFKFENDAMRISKDDNGVTFSEDQRDVDFRKSKLTATFLNASFVPVLDFSGRNRRSQLFDSKSGAFRIGIGPYAGYRIGSYSKLVYEDGNDRRRERDHDSYYLNNFRYGVRLQIGFRATDLFFNYDLNEVFADNKGPKVNAFSFGLTF